MAKRISHTYRNAWLSEIEEIELLERLADYSGLWNQKCSTRGCSHHSHDKTTCFVDSLSVGEGEWNGDGTKFKYDTCTQRNAFTHTKHTTQ